MMDVRSFARRAVMRVRFIGQIQASDFSQLATPTAERINQRFGGIEVLILDVRLLSGWEALTAFAEQIRFLRRFGRMVRRVAVLGNQGWRGAAPALAALFVEAEIRCFLPGENAALRRWIRSG